MKEFVMLFFILFFIIPLHQIQQPNAVALRTINR